MPSSRPNHIPTIVGITLELNPRSVLDIGVGFGQWGHLIREYTDIRLSEDDPERYHKKNWRVRIDGIEGFADYLTPMHEYIYDEVLVGDMREVIDRVGRYDMILIADVIEHVGKEDGLALLRKCLERCDGAVVVSTPSKFVEQGAMCGNPLEVHRSFWEESDFVSFPGARTEVTENDILVAVLPTSGVKAPRIQPPVRRGATVRPRSMASSPPLWSRVARRVRNGLLYFSRTTSKGLVGEPTRFDGSSAYWENRYASGGNSGPGSYGRLAQYKADFINRFTREHGITTAIDYGVGDGNQLEFLEFDRYLGLDVSATAVDRLCRRYAADPTRRFAVVDPSAAVPPDYKADLAMSLDVIFHLVEDAVFYRYMQNLFSMAARYVIIYSSDRDGGDSSAPHVRHRSVTAYIRDHCPGWRLIQTEANPHADLSFARFFVFESVGANAETADR